MSAATLLPGGASVWVPALLIAVGMAGIVLPVLPGLLLVVGGVVLWAVLTGGVTAWVVAGAGALLAGAGTLLQYLLPGRRMRRAGVGTLTLGTGAALALVGFVVVPVVGLPLGFVLGVYLAELARTRGQGAEAWDSTRSALGAVVQSMGIELLTGLAVLAVWLTGVALTRG